MQIKTADGTQTVAGGGTTGMAITGLALGGLALAGMSHGGLFGNRTESATKADIANVKELMAKDSEIAILKSENFTNSKIADVYERLKADINSLERTQNAWNASQSVVNAQMSSAIATNTNSISALQTVVSGITKIIVPKDAVCPEYMNRYNSWTAPTTPTQA